MKKFGCALLAMMLAFSMIGCGSSSTASTTAAAETEAATEAAAETEAPETEAPETEAAEGETIVLAAAASLKYVFDEQLIPMFEEANPGITVEATYDSSGKLQTQIEEGADWDVFFSAGMKQMTALQDEGLVIDDTVEKVLANELVLIVPNDSELGIESVQDVPEKCSIIAIGDPADVPVGQYAQNALTELGLWDAVNEKEVSLGTNVTEVLNWVAEGSVDCGFTYRTDAYQKADEVTIIEGLAPATYPAAVIASTSHEEAARTFEEFLSTPEAMEQFIAYGFSELAE